MKNNTNTNRYNYNLLPYPVILAATAGDEDALNAVIRHYGGYIAKLSLRPLYDENGDAHYSVDEGIRRQLETKLVEAVLKFKAA
jgi:hypothetical protein